MPLIGKKNIKNVNPLIIIIGDQLNKSELEPGDLLFDVFGYTYIMPNDRVKVLLGTDPTNNIIISLCGPNSNTLGFGFLQLDKLDNKLKYFDDHDFDIIGIVKNIIDLDKIHDKNELKTIFLNNNNFLKYRDKITQLYASY